MTGYAEIAEYFRQRINSGELQPGDRLPPLRQLMEDFGVAQQTVSRAYKTLRAEGLISGRRGGGTVVADSGSASLASRVSAWAQTGRALGDREDSRIVEVGTVSADEAIAARLDVEPGTRVYLRRRVVSRDGHITHMTSSYYPAYVVDATPELTEPTSTGGSRELAAERLGVDQDKALEEVTSRLATDVEREALGLTGDTVVITQVMRTVWLTDGRPVEVARKIVSGETVLRWTQSMRR